MKHLNRDTIAVLIAAMLSIGLIAGISVMTNSVDPYAFMSDIRYYIDMAEHGFSTVGASPFAYRYVTTLIVHGLVGLLGVSIEGGFRIVAYIGAFLQLVGVFLFTRWFTRSTKGAYVALLVTAFSLFNVKYLFFDVYRPDHLAYALILLQTYLAFKRKFVPLLLVTLVASQIREFNLIPLIAYLFAFWRDRERSIVLREAAVSVIGILLAIGLPRILIPVAENYQFADFSLVGLLRVLLAPLVLVRDVNFLYTVVAYLLPVLLLARLGDMKAVLQALSLEVRYFLAAYVGLVLAFSFVGGTDFFRFATFLFMPQAILLGLLVPRARVAEIVFMILVVFVFNRIWLPFPSRSYIDLYGGYSTRFDTTSIMRLLECAGLLLLGLLVKRVYHPTGLGSRLAENDLHE